MSAITLDRAKHYLRLDDDKTELGDLELQSMITAAEQFVERRTGHIFTPKSKTYYKAPDGVIRVYDTPITTDLSIYTYDQKNGYVAIHYQESVTLTVGYTDVFQIPQALVNAALQVLKVWYYESESQTNEALVPISVREALHSFRRFVV